MAFANALHQMIEVADAAGGDYRYRDAVRDRPGERNVKTLSGAVPVHRGQQDLAGAERDDLPGIFDSIDPGGIASAMGEDFPPLRAAAAPDALGVDCDHDALIAEFFRRFLDEFAPADGGAVDRNLVGAGAQ